jgi:AraC-like DNA-binding protein
MDFWIFSLDDPELHSFYAANTDNASLYYLLYIEKCLIEFAPDKKKVMHLQDNCILLLDHYLVPVFYHLPLKAYLIVLAETFYKLDITKALLKFVFFHNKPEGIRSLGTTSPAQKKCIDLILEEYHKEHDDYQATVLRSLMVNLLLLSPEVDYFNPLKSGHLINYALQFMDLINIYAFQEKQKSFYAEKIGITEKTLTQALQEVFNKTFREILIYKTLIDAMKILVFTDKSITQIAHELNYDASGFNKLFLKWKGLSPKDLRINYRILADYVENNC